MQTRRSFIKSCFQACAVGVALAYGKLPEKVDFWAYHNNRMESLTAKALNEMMEKLQRDFWEPDLVVVHPKHYQSLRGFLNG